MAGIEGSPGLTAQRTWGQGIDHSPFMIAQRRQLSGMFGTAAPTPSWAKPIQRTILPMGQTPGLGADAKAIANQNEVQVSAEVVRKKHNGPVTSFEDPSAALTDGPNHIIGHSDGQVMFGHGTPAYDHEAVGSRLVDMKVTPATKIRLLGCHTGAWPGAIAERTAQYLNAQGIPGVEVKGAAGEIIKTPTTSGVHDLLVGGHPKSGVAHSRLSNDLAKAQAATAMAVCDLLEVWVDDIAGIADSVDFKLGAYDFAKCAQSIHGGGGFTREFTLEDIRAELLAVDRAGMANKAKGFIASQRKHLRSRVLTDSGNRFRALMAGVIPAQDHVPGLAACLEDHEARVLDLHNRWLQAPLVEGATRKPKGEGNETFTS